MFKIPNKYLILFVYFSFLFLTNVYSQDNLKKGIDAVNKGDYVSALNLLKDVVKSDKSYDANYNYGEALFRTGSIEEAIKYLNIALADDDEGIMALKDLGEIYTQKKDYNKANDYFKKAIKVEPQNIPVLIAKAAMLSAQGKIDPAIEVLTLASSIDKEHPDPMVFVGLGDAWYARGTSPKIALDNYQKALKLKSNLAVAYYGLGRVYFKMKKYNDAINSFNIAIEKDPNYAPAYLEMGKILYFNGDFPKAAASFIKYSKLRPGTQEGNSYYAKTLYAQGKFDEAIALLTDVLKNDPKSVTGNLYTAYIYAEREQTDSLLQIESYNKAIEYFQKVNIEDMDVDDLVKYANVNVNLKNYDNAIPLYRKAIVLDSSNSDVYYNFGKMFFKSETYDSAIAYFTLAENYGMIKQSCYIYAGLSNFYLKKYDDAIKQFREILKLDDKNTFAYTWIGKCYFVMGNNDEAIKSYETILTYDPQNAETLDVLKRIKKQ
jgi:tetratricopeptide (TPR) repeat protein